MTLQVPTRPHVLDTPTYDADVLLRDGRLAHLRTVGPDDRVALTELYDRADEANIYLRFFSLNRVYADRFVNRVCISDSNVSTLVATIDGFVMGMASSEKIARGQAEIALFVDDRSHGMGIGTLLLEHLAGWQRGNGIETFVAEVLTTNSAMLDVFRNAGFEMSSQTNRSVVTLKVNTSLTKALTGAVNRRKGIAERASLQNPLEPPTLRER